MPATPRVIDLSLVLRTRIFCQDVSSADLADRPLTVEAEFMPGAWSGYHVHPHQDESFELLSGTLEVFVQGRWRRLQQGESVLVPKGTAHGFRNTTAAAARAMNTHDPGLRILDYWQGIERLIREGRVSGMDGLRNGLYLSLLVTEFRREIVVVRPPDWFLRLLAALGRTFGFTLHEPRESGSRREPARRGSSGRAREERR